MHPSVNTSFSNFDLYHTYSACILRKICDFAELFVHSAENSKMQVRAICLADFWAEFGLFSVFMPRNTKSTLVKSTLTPGTASQRRLKGKFANFQQL